VVDSALITLIEEAEVPARTPGLIQQIPVETGDLVAAKDLLVQLETADSELVVQRARHEVDIARQQARNESKVNIARKTYETAQRAVRRAEDSNAKRRDSVTEAELDKLRLEAFTAESQIRQAETDLGVAKATHELKEVELRQAELAAPAGPGLSMHGEVIKAARQIAFEGSFPKPRVITHHIDHALRGFRLGIGLIIEIEADFLSAWGEDGKLRRLTVCRNIGP
jgi:multidrug efflux pump subunit AcrA (membrane-fusion protein)